MGGPVGRPESPLRKRRVAQAALVSAALTIAAVFRPCRTKQRNVNAAPVPRKVQRRRTQRTTGPVQRQTPSTRPGIWRAMPSIATIVALGGLLFTAAQVTNERSATKEQLALLSVQTSNETFAQAITALGDDRMPIRVGGIYVLQQVADTSESNYWRALSVLTAYLHEAIPRDDLPGTPSARPTAGLPADVQAVFAALSERNQEWDNGRSLDLSRLDLRNANLPSVKLQGTTLSYSILNGTILTNADLRNAALIQASLQSATLDGADLRNASLADADLSYARLEGANLQGASLTDAQLTLASLRNAQLQNVDFDRANLLGVNLTGANLEGADLSTATGLNPTQIASAITDEHTRLPWETDSDATPYEP